MMMMMMMFLCCQQCHRRLIFVCGLVQRPRPFWRREVTVWPSFGWWKRVNWIAGYSRFSQQTAVQEPPGRVHCFQTQVEKPGVLCLAVLMLWPLWVLRWGWSEARFRLDVGAPLVFLLLPEDLFTPIETFSYEIVIQSSSVLQTLIIVNNKSRK